MTFFWRHSKSDQTFMKFKNGSCHHHERISAGFVQFTFLSFRLTGKKLYKLICFYYLRVNQLCIYGENRHTYGAWKRTSNRRERGNMAGEHAIAFGVNQPRQRNTLFEVVGLVFFFLLNCKPIFCEDLEWHFLAWLKHRLCVNTKWLI